MRTTKYIFTKWVAVLLLAGVSGYLNAQIITTVAGNGSIGYSGDGVAATSTALNLPHAVTVDAIGNLFIADEYNNRIRKVDTNGIITTVAGNGYVLGLGGNGGFSGDGGPATSAKLSHPVGVALDASGNLYIVDSENNRIRKVGVGGTITTVAGGGQSYPGNGGAATSALLGNPRGMAVDAAGNLYIADTGFHRITKVGSAGLITTVAGMGFGNAGYSGDGGAAASAKLYNPEGVAVDAAGNLYIADTRNNRIRKVDAGGTITTVAGRHGQVGGLGDGGPATSARLDDPTGVALDAARNLYIADRSQYRIRKVSASDEIFKDGFDL